jgi:hypothetical protein
VFHDPQHRRPHRLLDPLSSFSRDEARPLNGRVKKVLENQPLYLGFCPVVLPPGPVSDYFRFGGPDMERLVKGRERIYLDRFWNEFSANPRRFSETARRHYAKLCSR